MASIQKVDGKTGVSYRFFVSTGRDSDGKQIKHTKTWRPAPGMTDRQMEKAAQKAAAEFERSIELGYVADDRQSFQEYAEYVLDLKERSGAKHKTIESYRFLLARINPAIGFMKLQDIRPQHLNQMYKSLSKSGLRADKGRATPKDDTIRGLLKKQKLSHQKAAELAELSAATVDKICKGETVSLESAQKLCESLGLELKKCFKVERDMRPLSNKSLLEYHRCVHTILAQAEREMLIPYNPAEKATPPKVTRKEVNSSSRTSCAGFLTRWTRSR